MTQAPERLLRKVVNLTEAQWSDVNEWRHERRIATEAEALRQLISIGLRAGARAVPTSKRKKP